MLDTIDEAAKILEEARNEISAEAELTELRNESTYLRKENFEMKEKIRDLEDRMRDLHRVVVCLQPSTEEIQIIEDELDDELAISVIKEPKRWVAFAPTSYRQVRIGAQLKFTRGREVMTANVCWVGQKPMGSNNFLIGAETEEDLVDPDCCSDLWECNEKRSVLLPVHKIIVAWDWDNILQKL